MTRTYTTGVFDVTLYEIAMVYDGTGRRISKTRWVKVRGDAGWSRRHVTHYTGIGTEIRENFAGGSPETKVVVDMPEGLGRYGIEDVAIPYSNINSFEWYLKNHLGSTMLVYGTVASTNPNEADVGEKIAAYDYRSFGEMVELTPPPTGKVTENFTGSRFARRTQRTACKSIAEPKNLGAKRNEHDDEIALNYFGARYLDSMLGMWISVDPKRQYQNPYLYAGNNPIIRIDPDGTLDGNAWGLSLFMNNVVKPQFNNLSETAVNGTLQFVETAGKIAGYSLAFAGVAVPVAYAAVGVQVPVLLMRGFIAFNALSSGMENGSKGVISSLLIDVSFYKLGKVLPGGALSKTIRGSSRRAASVGAQGVSNTFSHDVTNYIESFEMPAEMIPVSSPDMLEIDVSADNTYVNVEY